MSKKRSLEMRYLVLAAALLSSACYNPKPPSGGQLCAGDGSCAKGYVCGPDNHCYLAGQVPVGTVDMAMKGAVDMAVASDMAACTQSSCAAPNPICDPNSGQCVPCTQDSHCQDGQLCVMNKCVSGCSMNPSSSTSNCCPASVMVAIATLICF